MRRFHTSVFELSVSIEKSDKAPFWAHTSPWQPWDPQSSAIFLKIKQAVCRLFCFLTLPAWPLMMLGCKPLDLERTL
jgi:hypothetical protein